jgi:hypothetical protein
MIVGSATGQTAARIGLEQDSLLGVPLGGRHVPARTGRHRREQGASMRASERPIPRRGLSRVEAAAYIGVSPSKFDELRKANRIAPPKVLDGRLIFTIERLDEFLDALPDENQTADEHWTASL